MKLQDVLATDDPDAICPHFYRLAASVWKKSFTGVLEADDAVQAAVWDCWRRRGEYDPDRSPAGPYFTLVAWSAMNVMKRWALRPCRQQNTVDLVDADGAVDDFELPDLDALEQFADRTSVLSERQLDVVMRRLDGEMLREIGADLGVTRERVRQVEKRALELLGAR